MKEFLSRDVIISYISPLIKQGVTFIDALTEFMKVNDIDYEVLAKIIKDDESLFNAIKEEASSSRLLKKESHKLDLLDFK